MLLLLFLLIHMEPMLLLLLSHIEDKGENLILRRATPGAATGQKDKPTSSHSIAKGHAFAIMEGHLRE